MRVEREKKFEPVKLILESQEEVDKLYAISAHTLIHNRLSLQDLRHSLYPLVSDNFRIFLDKLQEIHRW